jgi:hypothetical protein
LPQSAERFFIKKEVFPHPAKRFLYQVIRYLRLCRGRFACDALFDFPFGFPVVFDRGFGPSRLRVTKAAALRPRLSGLDRSNVAALLLTLRSAPQAEGVSSSVVA